MNKNKENWIKWYGWTHPVDENVLVEVEFRNGNKMKILRKHLDWRWNKDSAGRMCDIIAYRVVDEEECVSPLKGYEIEKSEAAFELKITNDGKL